MSVDDNVYVNEEQFADFDLLEDLDTFEHYDSPSIDSSKSFELCIPRDPLHEVFETFPSLTSNNQPITWSDLGINPDFENVSFGESFHNFEPNVEKEEEQEVEEIKSLEMIKAGLSGFVIKKPRSKRFCQKGTKKEVFFGEAQLKNREQSGTIRDLFAKPELENREKSLKKKCAHCQVQTTPQWRAGPLGPKTLCNACGVRFKSGRLLPEYRPAASPEYDGKKYSNFHKRIMMKKAMYWQIYKK